MTEFDPNGPATYDGIFGLPFEENEAKLIILPVPWQVTVSYGEGTALAPEAIKEASKQVDLYHHLNPNGWKQGIYMAPVSHSLLSKGLHLRNKVRNYLENFSKANGADPALIDEVNAGCEEMVDWVYSQSKKYLNQGKKLILLGGDHSTPLGYLKALAEEHPSFGVLQIDAHMDFRCAYEGFEYSHASISFNFMKFKQIKKVVQVGIRDYCTEELSFANQLGDRVKIFFDSELKKSQYKGKLWDTICDEILAEIPEKFYITFDIDGLDPKLCPNTGTPVPGGLTFSEIEYLFEKILHSGKKIIGADLNEVGVHPTHEWDANVGARILFLLCNIL